MIFCGFYTKAALNIPMTPAQRTMFSLINTKTKRPKTLREIFWGGHLEHDLLKSLRITINDIFMIQILNQMTTKSFS